MGAKTRCKLSIAVNLVRKNFTVQLVGVARPAWLKKPDVSEFSAVSYISQIAGH